MILLKPTAEIMYQCPGVDGLMRHVERCGRTSYKSDSEITENSCNEFIANRIQSCHTAILEHGAVYLQFSVTERKKSIPEIVYLYDIFNRNKYSITKLVSGTCYVSTNLRVIIENNLQEVLQFMCPPSKHHEKIISVKFIVDRGVSHELVRHRAMSFVQESTRFCNYSKNRFGNELTFIIPCWLDLKEGCYITDWDRISDIMYWGWFGHVGGERIKSDWNKGPGLIDSFLGLLSQSEESYLRLIERGWKPQEARSILPNSLKTEIIVTGFAKDWLGGERKIQDGIIEKWGFFPLRCAQSAHPQMREVTIPLLEKFIEEVDPIFKNVKY